jgi:hypothetical protein
MDKDQAVGAITNTPGVHDIGLAPQFHCGFASNSREDKMTIFNLRSLRTSKAKTVSLNGTGSR